MSADLDSGSLSRYERNLDWLTANLGGPILKDTLYFYGSYYRPTAEPGQPVQPLRRAARLREHAQRGLRQADLHPDADDPPERELPGLEARRHQRPSSPRTPRPPPAPGSESRLKIFTGDGSWVINPSSFVTFKYTHFENLTAGTPDFVADVDPNLAPGTRLDINSLDTHRAPHRPDPGVRPDRLQRVHPAAHRPVRLQRRTGCRRAAAPWASAASSTTRTSSATRRRSPTTSPSARACGTSCTSATSGTRTRRTSSAARTAGASSPSPAGGSPRRSRGTPSGPTTPRASSSSRPARRCRSSRSTAPRASSSTTPSSGATGPSTSACSSATTPSTDRGCARTRRRSPGTSRPRATATRCTSSAGAR